ncbi:adenylyl-sulfate kinase [Flexivirga oryzae]|uniref:Adenylyl-sulfate kinase n=1 Tax=Flexivirga oryzae TaxID=1794944 RepID=A0A839N9L3_9MICO|nr:adenylyl-sulfate kinase [Flexivirga oryzae]MBB2894468.1 sulfate adenylyltransferase [Flexivirga oryzae]
MPEPRAPQICPPLETLDDLLLLRDGIPVLGPEAAQRLYLPEATEPGRVELVDPEGVPFARVDLTQSSDGHATLTAPPEWLGTVSTRPFEQLYTPPASVRADLDGDGTTVIVDRPLQAGDLDRFGDAELTLLVLAGPSIEPGAAALSSIRSALTAAAQRADTRVVAVPLTAARATAEPALLETVTTGYGAGAAARLPATTDTPGNAGGLVLFFTGLSGSGKSTVARAVRNGILERDGRPVTLLDGDVVRRNLSAGLGFSPADRETNIRRIGWVAAELAHHGGLAICSPIAPYDRTRKEVRRMVTERGGTLVLVHIATPVEECERRDRKGLYAKARRGEIPNFTGISAPYERPEDADLVLDTTDRSIEAVRDDVLGLLTRRDLLSLGR